MSPARITNPGRPIQIGGQNPGVALVLLLKCAGSCASNAYLRIRVDNSITAGMGGCCCSSRKRQLHGTPIYYYVILGTTQPQKLAIECPPVLEENELLTSHNSAATVLATGFLVDLNLDGSTPDTYRSPPAPIPYGVVLGRPQPIDTESLRETINGSVFENLPFADLKESHCTTDTAIFLSSPKKLEVELLKSDELNVSEMEEEDVCPTCLEDYDAENPKIITKCNHYFHLSCILEWTERSDTCPICDQEMIFEAIEGRI
ncbi:unnamed protein product [Camellia sinensis]